MDFLLILDYIGIIAFAITGALVAARKGSDIIGFIMLGTVTGIGGGTVRDAILGNTPVFWVEQPIYLTLCFTTSCAMFFCAHFMDRYRRVIVWADALGMALFTVVGARIALEAGAGASVAILMGMMTASFGGIIRDTLSMQESLILRKEIYASASFVGAASLVAIREYTPLSDDCTLWCAITITFALRAIAVKFNLSLPGYKWLRNDPARHG